MQVRAFLVLFVSLLLVVGPSVRAHGDTDPAPLAGHARSKLGLSATQALGRIARTMLLNETWGADAGKNGQKKQPSPAIQAAIDAYNTRQKELEKWSTSSADRKAALEAASNELREIEKKIDSVPPTDPSVPALMKAFDKALGTVYKIMDELDAAYAPCRAASAALGAATVKCSPQDFDVEDDAQAAAYIWGFPEVGAHRTSYQAAALARFWEGAFSKKLSGTANLVHPATSHAFYVWWAESLVGSVGRTKAAEKLKALIPRMDKGQRWAAAASIAQVLEAGGRLEDARTTFEEAWEGHRAPEQKGELSLECWPGELAVLGKDIPPLTGFDCVGAKSLPDTTGKVLVRVGISPDFATSGDWAALYAVESLVKKHTKLGVSLIGVIKESTTGRFPYSRRGAAAGAGFTSDLRRNNLWSVWHAGQSARPFADCERRMATGAELTFPFAVAREGQSLGCCEPGAESYVAVVGRDGKCSFFSLLTNLSLLALDESLKLANAAKAAAGDGKADANESGGSRDGKKSKDAENTGKK
jgi:hypothetical protein